jgi:hypothetical protein
LLLHLDTLLSSDSPVPDGDTFGGENPTTISVRCDNSLLAKFPDTDKSVGITVSQGIPHVGNALTAALLLKKEKDGSASRRHTKLDDNPPLLLTCTRIDGVERDLLIESHLENLSKGGLVIEVDVGVESERFQPECLEAATKCADVGLELEEKLTVSSAGFVADESSTAIRIELHGNLTSSMSMVEDRYPSS